MNKTIDNTICNGCPCLNNYINKLPNNKTEILVKCNLGYNTKFIEEKNNLLCISDNCELMYVQTNTHKIYKINNKGKNMTNRNEKWLDDRNIEDYGYFTLFGEINQNSVKATSDWIIHHNINSKKLDKLVLVVNSLGGSGEDAFALIDMIKGSKIPITTVGIGVVSSAGLLIFISGKLRILTPNTMILSHQYSWGSIGKHHELLAATKGFDIFQKITLDHYKKCTGLTEKVINEKLLSESDTWLTAQEAKKLNLCDEIKKIY